MRLAGAPESVPENLPENVPENVPENEPESAYWHLPRHRARAMTGAAPIGLPTRAFRVLEAAAILKSNDISIVLPRGFSTGAPRGAG